MLSQKVCVVTGSNKGIGFAIVKDLCKKFDGIVYLTSRDEGKGKAAVRELEKENLSPKYRQLDIDDQESINKFANYIKSTYNGLDVLVNNAGIAYKNAATEPFGEQAENTVRVNYFATKNLCHALFPLLRPHARVVHVSSSSGHLSRINGDEPQADNLRKKLASPSLTELQVDDLLKDFVKHAKIGDWKQQGWPDSTYVVSKVGVSALTRVQQKEFDADSRADLVVNSCHPGLVDTDMNSHKGRLTIEQGAVCPVYLALLPKSTNEIKGAYLWFDKTVVDWFMDSVKYKEFFNSSQSEVLSLIKTVEKK